MDKKDILYTDNCFNEFTALTNLLQHENDSQIKKWGVQKHNLFEWLAYTTEELGELSKAISEYVYRNGKRHDIIKEAIQTATLCLKIAEMNMSYDIDIMEYIERRKKENIHRKKDICNDCTLRDTCNWHLKGEIKK